MSRKDFATLIPSWTEPGGPEPERLSSRCGWSEHAQPFYNTDLESCPTGMTHIVELVLSERVLAGFRAGHSRF
jgi:hypothetical protein